MFLFIIIMYVLYRVLNPFYWLFGPSYYRRPLFFSPFMFGPMFMRHHHHMGPPMMGPRPYRGPRGPFMF